MQASDHIDFIQPITDPNQESFSDGEMAKAIERFNRIKKMLAAKVRENAGLAREYPVPEGLITIGETCFAIEYADGSYLWASYWAILINGGDGMTTIGITLEEHEPDDRVSKRHFYVLREGEPVRRYTDENPAETTDRYCMVDEQKYLAYYMAHSEESEDILDAYANEAENIILEEMMGYNRQPVDAEELTKLQLLLRDSISYAPEPKVA